jgi:hypothetical protein
MARIKAHLPNNKLGGHRHTRPSRHAPVKALKERLELGALWLSHRIGRKGRTDLIPGAAHVGSPIPGTRQAETGETIRMGRLPFLFLVALLGVAQPTYAQGYALPPRSSPDEAMRDFNAHKALPGLPNLKKPVFIVRKALVCSSLNALGNPNVGLLVATGACASVNRRVRVSVLLPVDAEDYVNSHVFGAIQIAWRSANRSVGNVYTGWVRIDQLTN